MAKPDFHTSLFLREMFGNAQGVVSFLRAYDAPVPQEAAVAKWFSRQSIPSDWLPTLLVYLEMDRGGPLSLVSYVGGKK